MAYKIEKGFTLVELIAIILVLSAIFLVSFPSILNSAKKGKEEEYNNMVKNLCLAGETYIYSNIENYDQLKTVSSTINIAVKDLIEYGNVDASLTNPKTGALVENSTLVYTVSSDLTLVCEYEGG